MPSHHLCSVQCSLVRGWASGGGGGGGARADDVGDTTLHPYALFTHLIASPPTHTHTDTKMLHSTGGLYGTRGRPLRRNRGQTSFQLHRTRPKTKTNPIQSSVNHRGTAAGASNCRDTSSTGEHVRTPGSINLSPHTHTLMAQTPLARTTLKSQNLTDRKPRIVLTRGGGYL